MKFRWKSIPFVKYFLNSDPVRTSTFKRPKGYIFQEEMVIRRNKSSSFDILIIGFSVLIIAIAIGEYLVGIICLIPFIYFYVIPYIDKSPQIILTKDYIYIKNQGKIRWKEVKETLVQRKNNDSEDTYYLILMMDGNKIVKNISNLDQDYQVVAYMVEDFKRRQRHS